MAGIEIRGRDAVEAAETTSGIVRRVMFETEDTVVVDARIAGETTTDWHHHGDHHDFAYVVEGQVTLEFGPEGSEVLDARAGEFIHIPPRTVHRDRNPVDQEAIVVTSLVGSGPLVVNVDGPDTD